MIRLKISIVVRRYGLWVICYVIVLSFLITRLSSHIIVFASEKLWEIQSIDTMKYSRDASRNPVVKKIIPVHVKAVADTGANYIAIDTPYDDEFIPILKLWVEEARKNNLKVWFRGNFSGWEGWFGYPRLSDPSEHITKTFRFITENSDLFSDGDIFTPAPEEENGIMGDPRRTGKVDEFNKFLLDSFDNCNSAFGQINKKVNCGVWSLNTDVLKETVRKETIQKMGGVISIDHYTKTPEKLIADVKYLHDLFGAQVVLGEFGMPIPDINGEMTEKEQADQINKTLQYLYKNREIVAGMNYWVIAGGSTTLLNDDNSPRLAVAEMKKYFDPAITRGRVLNTVGEVLKDMEVKPLGTSLNVKTDDRGEYSFTLPAQNVELGVGSGDYRRVQRQIVASSGANLQEDFILEPLNESWGYKLKLLWRKITAQR